MHMSTMAYSPRSAGRVQSLGTLLHVVLSLGSAQGTMWYQRRSLGPLHAIPVHEPFELSLWPVAITFVI